MFFTIKLYLHLNCVLLLNWIVWNRTIFIKMDLALNKLQWLICHITQTTNQPKCYYWINQDKDSSLSESLYYNYFYFSNKFSQNLIDKEISGSLPFCHRTGYTSLILDVANHSRNINHLLIDRTLTNIRLW